jgi:predicted NBD/HSP70 family sugar kinase
MLGQNNLTNENHLVPAASILDPWALTVIKQCTYPLARMLLNVVIAAGLDKVVVIGGFALTLGKVYLEMLRDCLIESSNYQIIGPYIPDLVMMGDYTEEACLEGAAVYAQRLPVIKS